MPTMSFKLKLSKANFLHCEDRRVRHDHKNNDNYSSQSCARRLIMATREQNKSKSE